MHANTPDPHAANPALMTEEHKQHLIDAGLHVPADRPPLRSIAYRNRGSLRFRVRKGVTPFGGRTLYGRRETAPNGRRYVVLYADTYAGNSPMQRDERTYREDEVDEIK